MWPPWRPSGRCDRAATQGAYGILRTAPDGYPFVDAVVSAGSAGIWACLISIGS